MYPLTEPQIRDSFVNASVREVKQALLPDLDALDWDELDYLGWTDAKRPLMAYLVAEVYGSPVGLVLRRPDPGQRTLRKAICTLCEDVVETSGVAMFTAKRAGAAGRKGDTVGTMLCTDLRCSANVRRRPTLSEVGSQDPVDVANYTQRRIDGLRSRTERFVQQVASTR